MAWGDMIGEVKWDGLIGGVLCLGVDGEMGWYGVG